MINQYCPGPAFNAGGVNVKIFPPWALPTSSTGLPVDPLYLTYVMMPLKSHWGIDLVDEC